jgi:23S rRNA (cytidine1920-2'-O)/16S rRNA (cytidine1409-2'-O)-methyltransferase
MKKVRLDELLVLRGLAETRSRAKALILSGAVFRGSERLDKAGTPIEENAEITVKEKEHPYVSRGGMKLSAALEHFKIDVRGKRALDVGASTGGFTDCLLQNGAESVLALDVGKGQLDWKLRNDERVTVLEKFNARELSPEAVGGMFDIAVIDVSFISLELVLGPVKSVTAPGGMIITLLKPQFEAGRAEADRGRGVIKDETVREKAVEKIAAHADELGIESAGRMESPVKGAKGNVEYLLAFRRR